MSVATTPVVRRRFGTVRVTAISGNRLAVAGGILVALVVLMAVVSVFWTPYPSDQMNLPERFQPPSWEHLMGTDEFGRDVLSRVMVGARASLTISLVAVAGALLTGGVVALLVGYIGGVLDIVVMRIVDIFLAIPALLIALGIVAIMGPNGRSVAVSLAVAYAPTFARVVHSAVVSTRHLPYVEASQGLGARSPFVLRKDIFPNVLPVIIVQATTALAWGILDEANLGFLGLGVQPPNPSWGSILIEGRTYFYQATWLPIGAGIAVTIAVFGFNMLGDGLRDILDPRAWRRE